MRVKKLKPIDLKHSIAAEVDVPEDLSTNLKEELDIDLYIEKHTNGTRIPDDEPVILFRARDRLALPMLEYYRVICQDDHATQYQLDQMKELIDKFQVFADTHPDVMKQPGSSLGK